MRPAPPGSFVLGIVGGAALACLVGGLAIMALTEPRSYTFPREVERSVAGVVIDCTEPDERGGQWCYIDGDVDEAWHEIYGLPMPPRD